MEHVEINPITHKDGKLSHSNEDGLVSPDTEQLTNEISGTVENDTATVNELVKNQIEESSVNGNENVNGLSDTFYNDDSNLKITQFNGDRRGNLNDIRNKNQIQSENNIGDGQENIKAQQLNAESILTNTGDGKTDTDVRIVNQDSVKQIQGIINDNGATAHDNKNNIVNKNIAASQNERAIGDDNAEDIKNEASIRTKLTTSDNDTGDKLSEEKVTQVVHTDSTILHTDSYDRSTTETANDVVSYEKEDAVVDYYNQNDNIPLEEDLQLKARTLNGQHDSYNIPSELNTVDPEIVKNTGGKTVVILNDSEIKLDNTVIVTLPQHQEKDNIAGKEESSIEEILAVMAESTDRISEGTFDKQAIRDISKLNQDVEGVSDDLGKVAAVKNVLNENDNLLADTTEIKSSLINMHGHDSTDINKANTDINHQHVHYNTLESSSITETIHATDRKSGQPHITYHSVNDKSEDSSIPLESYVVTPSSNLPSHEHLDTVMANARSVDTVEYEYEKHSSDSGITTNYEDLSASFKTPQLHKIKQTPLINDLKTSRVDGVLQFDMQDKDITTDSNIELLKRSEEALNTLYEPLVNEHNEEHFEHIGKDLTSSESDSRDGENDEMHSSFNLLSNILKDDVEFAANSESLSDNLNNENKKLFDDVEFEQEHEWNSADIKPRLENNEERRHVLTADLRHNIISDRTEESERVDRLPTQSDVIEDEEYTRLGLSLQCCVA